MIKSELKSPLEILKKYWNYNVFRSLQAEIIESVLERQDTLALLPTGGGKSLCFQVPALCLGQLCLVVSPLVALMQDQVEQLRAKGLRAACLYSDLSFETIDYILEQAQQGQLDFLYLSPERLKTDIFLTRFPQMKVGLIAIDEAHCISQWGYDFRPPYLEIAKLRKIQPQVPMLALTASATPLVVQDIIDKLELKKVKKFQKSFFRANIAYQVIPSNNKLKDVLTLCQKEEGSGVIYLGSRSNVEYVSDFLKENGVSADFYHAGISSDLRTVKQKKWIAGETRVMVATNAFGMGIDKSDVRFVAHLTIPLSPEAYFQEAGRGGRDEKMAVAQLFFAEQDIKILEKSVQRNYPDPEMIRKTYHAICNYGKIAVGSGLGSKIFLPNLFDFAKTFELSEIYPCLRILELEEYCSFQEKNTAYAQAQILYTREQLILWLKNFPEYANILRFLVRNYSNIFTEKVSIYEHQLAFLLRKKVEEVKNILLDLKAKKIIFYQASGQENVIYFLKNRIQNDYFTLRKDRYYARKKDAEIKAQAMSRYVQSSVCRSRYLLSYFGEHQGQACGICDVCLAKQPINFSQMEKEFRAWVLQQEHWNFKHVHLYFPRMPIEILEQVIDNFIKQQKIKFEDGWFHKI